MKLLYFLAAIGMLFCLSDLVYAKHKTRKKLHRTYYATAVASPGIYGASQLSSTLNYMINASHPNADVGVYVKSMKFGDSLYARAVSKPLTPASTLKIFTAEAALLFLGPSYRFSTQLLTDASAVKNGVLQGNLYVVLSGDPTLTYNDLDDLLQTLQTHQIQAISGNVYLDNTAYDQSFYGPGWVRKDRDNCYGAPISASIINHNCLSFKVPASKVSGRNLSLPRRRYSFAVSSVVSDIPDYNRTLFKSLLFRLGIKVYGTVTFGSAPNQLSLVGAHSSKTLPHLITEMLKKSDNIIAGALFKKIGQLYSRQPGSWSNGSLAVSQILAKRAGVNIAGMRILDGSGLSPNNLATPAQMMQVLDFAYHHGPTNYDFMSALPIAGVDGTLKHRMTNIIRKVRAKTGTISGVVSLAGYTISADKEPLAFVIMINGSSGMGWRYKGLEDKIVTALTRYKR